MRTRREKLDQACQCGADMYRVSMKNPYIDDYVDECVGEPEKCSNAHRALSMLTASARAQARREHDDE